MRIHRYIHVYIHINIGQNPKVQKVFDLPVFLSLMPGGQTQSTWFVRSLMNGLIDGNDTSAHLRGSRNIWTQ